MKTHLIIAAFFMLISCTKDDPSGKEDPGLVYGQSFLVLNEGGFGQGNASICLMDARLDSDCAIYEAQVGIPLGDVLHSGETYGDQLFLVVNGSGRLVRLDLPGLDAPSVLEGLTSPRYFLPLSATKAYVSDLYGREVHVIDPSRMVKTGSIPFPGWSERMALAGSVVWLTRPELFSGPVVEHIFMIDPATDQITDSLAVGRNPVDLVYDGMDRVYILSLGDVGSGTPAKITRVRVGDRSIDTSWTLPAAFSGKIAMHSQSNTLAVILDKVYQLDLERGELDQMVQLSNELTVPYGLSFDPRSSGQIWVSDAVDFSSAGKVILWDIENDRLIESRTTGINPNGLIFF